MRTNINTVKQIIQTSLDDTIILTHIGIASRMVDSYLGDKGYSDELLKDLETYWTAHLIAIGKDRTSQQTIARERIDGVGEVQYNTSTQSEKTLGKGLEASHYGQMVLALDTKKILNSIALKKASIRSINWANCK